MKAKSSDAMSVGLFLLVIFSRVTESRSLVKTLPGFFGDLPFTLETGYISVGESDDIQFFYYFVESERNPKNDPLLLWTRGGPGCSVLTSLFLQTGPITLNFANSTMENPMLELSDLSLTKVANIIYLDEPAGSGFSYAKSFEASLTNDTLTANNIYQFVRKWLVEHPDFINNPLYIGGDSYGGILVPMVVLKIYNGNEDRAQPQINIKGYVLGNPVTDLHDTFNSKIPHAHNLALLSDKLYESTKKNCHGEYVNVDPNNTRCIDDLQEVDKCLERIRLSNILAPFCDPLNTSISKVLRRSLSSLEMISMDIWSSDEVQTQWLCNSATAYTYAWANRRDVQEALHINEDYNGMTWVVCNKSLTFDTDKPVKFYKFSDALDVVAYHQQLSRKNCRALVYSGDHDLSLPYFSTLKWIESLKLLILNYWRPWYVEEQVAGYTMKFSSQDYRLTFATVKGGSHTASQNRRKECLSMFKKWFANEDL